jgi:hypothetical protein
MENLFREILLPSPSLSSTSLPLDTLPIQDPSSTASTTLPSSIMTGGVDWTCEEELQRILLDIVPNVQPDVDLGVDTINFPSALDLGLENFSTVGVY